MLEPGTRLGPYEILSPIGAGGMGEVFRAKDSRLDRSVAIKVLPSEFASNDSLRQRFEREARSISQLNHPNICTLHDVGSHDGVEYLVMELIDGETMASRIMRGPLSLPDVFRYGAQIAEALHVAHRAGITHRDLKPGNIMITKSGAKLLDFGLAKLTGGAVVGADEPTVQQPLTAEGAILGTFQYMAPEQLEGMEADARTDIFALGAVLYEMATGRRAFTGKTKTSLIAAIVKEQPRRIAETQPLTPPALEHVVEKCLEKDAEDRWQSAHDIAEELRWISGSSFAAGSGVSLARKRWRERAAWTLAACFAIALAASGFQFMKRNRPEAPAFAFTIAPSARNYESVRGVEISPDGRTFAFLARAEASAPRKIWLRSIAAMDARALDGTDGVTDLSWSNDSLSILFNADGKLKRIIADSGAVETLAQLGSNEVAMNSEGTILFSPTEGPLHQMMKGQKSEPITKLDAARNERAHGAPHFLPDGKRFLFLALAREPKQRLSRHYLYAGEIGSKDAKFLGEIPSKVAYSEPGYLLFVREGTLVAVPFDADELEFKGEPQKLADGVSYFKPAGWADFSASRNGIVAYSAQSAASSLAWFDSTGKQLGEPLRKNGTFGGLRIGRGGTRLTIAIVDPKIGTSDLWNLGLTRPTANRLTFDEGWEGEPVLTPDESKLYYASDHLGIPDIFVKTLGSAEDDRSVVVGEGEQFPRDVSPDGKYLVYESDPYGPTGNDLWILRTDGREKPRPFVRTPFREADPRFSPDGARLAYVSNETGPTQVYVKAFPIAAEARQISTVGGWAPRWAPHSKHLYFVERNRVMAVDIDVPDAEPRFLFGPEGEIRSLEVAPDGKKFLLEFRHRSEMEQPTFVIVNWPATLTKARQ